MSSNTDKNYYKNRDVVKPKEEQTWTDSIGNVAHNVGEKLNVAGEALRETIQPREETLGEKAHKAAENMKDDAKRADRRLSDQVYKTRDEWKRDEWKRDEWKRDDRTIGERIADKYNKTTENVQDSVKDTMYPNEPTLGERAQNVAFEVVETLKEDAKHVDRRISDAVYQLRDDLTKDNRTMGEKISDKANEIGENIKETLNPMPEPTLGEKAYNTAENLVEGAENMAKNADRKISEAVYRTRDEYNRDPRNIEEYRGVYRARNDATTDNRSIGDKISDTYNRATENIKESLKPREPTLGEKAHQAGENLKEDVKIADRKISDAAYKARDEWTRDNRTFGEKIQDKASEIGESIKETLKPDNRSTENIKESMKPREPTIGEKVERRAEIMRGEAKKLERQISDAAYKTRDELEKDSKTIGEKIADTYQSAKENVKETLKPVEKKIEVMKDSMEEARRIDKNVSDTVRREIAQDNRTVAEQIADKYNAPYYDRFGIPKERTTEIPEKTVVEPVTSHDTAVTWRESAHRIVENIDKKFSEVDFEIRDTSLFEPISTLSPSERALRQLERNFEMNEL